MTMPRFGEVPRIKFREAQRMIFERYGEDRSKDLDLSHRTNDGSENGHRRSTIPTSSSSRTIRRPSGRSTPFPIRKTPSTR